MTLIYKKHKLNIDQPESLTPPLLSLVYERHLVDYIFSFSIEYIPLLKFVSKEWYFYCKEIQVKSNESGIYWGFRIRDPTLLPLNNLINFSDITVISAEIGNLSLLKWAKENNCPWGTTCSSAAFNGHLNCLKYARQNGCPLDEDTCFFSALNGHVNCLKWARENGFPWKQSTCHIAAVHKHLDCLKWAKDNGCPQDNYICLLCNKGGGYGIKCERCKSWFCSTYDGGCANQCGMCGEVFCHLCEIFIYDLKCQTCGNTLVCCSKCNEYGLVTCVECLKRARESGPIIILLE